MPAPVMARAFFRGDKIMARKREMQVIENEAPLPPSRINGDDPALYPPELFDPDAESAGLDSALQAVVTELAGRDDESKVTVFQLTVERGQKRESYLYECPAAEFTLEDLQASYGAGDYRVKVYGRQAGTNYRTIHANKRVAIGTPRAVARGTAGVPVAQSAPGAPLDVSRAVADALAAPLGALVNAIAALSARGNDRASVIAEMKGFAEIFGVMRPAAAAAPDPLAGLGMLKQMADLVQSLSASRAPLNDDGEISGNAVLYKGIETVANMIQAARGQAAPDAAALPAPDAAALPAPSIAALPAQSIEDTEMRLKVKMQMLLFLNAAKSNLDTDLYANLILEQAPDEIIDAFAAENWFEQLTQIEAGFLPHKTWCEKLRGEVLSGLTSDDAPATLPANDNLPASGSSLAASVKPDGNT